MRISDWSSDVCSSDLHMMRKKKGIFITLGVVAVVALAIGGTIAYKYYQSFFAPSVTADAESLYVYTPWEFEDVMTSIGELHEDRKSVVKGKSVSVRVDFGGSRI